MRMRMYHVLRDPRTLPQGEKLPHVCASIHKFSLPPVYSQHGGGSEISSEVTRFCPSPNIHCVTADRFQLEISKPLKYRVYMILCAYVRSKDSDTLRNGWAWVDWKCYY